MKYRKPFTHVRHWADVSDTIKMMKSVPTIDRYLHGDLKPNFPVPAIPTTVGYMPEGEWSTQPYPSAYWYVCNKELLWTFFQKFGFVWERG